MRHSLEKILLQIVSKQTLWGASSRLSTEISARMISTLPQSTMKSKFVSGFGSTGSPACTRIGWAFSSGPVLASNKQSLRMTMASSKASANGLIDILTKELEHEKSTYVQPEEIASGPPNGFTLTESSGDTLMTLSKNYKDEAVLVDIIVNDQPEEEPFETEDGELDVDVGVEFNVTINRGKGVELVFECKSDGSYVDLLHVGLEPEDDEDMDDALYTGPVFDELDEELQEQFVAYLEERGITADLGEYLMQLVHDKEQREYMDWLEKVKNAIS